MTTELLCNLCGFPTDVTEPNESLCPYCEISNLDISPTETMTKLEWYVWTEIFINIRREMPALSTEDIAWRTRTDYFYWKAGWGAERIADRAVREYAQAHPNEQPPVGPNKIIPISGRLTTMTRT